MFFDTAIEVRELGKCYQFYARPQDRLKQFLARGRKQYFREFWALQGVSFQLRRGEVLGLVGRNGAGKSTLLQLICGTLQPTVGELQVRGRIAALLELGAGFNPEFTGRENVFMNAAVLGVPEDEIAAKFDAIVDFAGLRDFIDQPVKTYSSGMYVRLAFSVATSIEPDILVIDEALSVGDGAFARKSFERIMALKEQGATILFCSHSMYQVEALCSRAIWLEAGRVRQAGEVAGVVREYQAFLDALAAGDAEPAKALAVASPERRVRFLAYEVTVDGEAEKVAHSGQSSVCLSVRLQGPPGEPITLAAAILGLDEVFLASASTANDGLTLVIGADGTCQASIVFEPLLLLRGVYRLRAWILDAKGLFLHEELTEAARLTVDQQGLEQGVFAQPHRWKLPA